MKKCTFLPVKNLFEILKLSRKEQSRNELASLLIESNFGFISLKFSAFENEIFWCQGIFFREFSFQK